MVLSIPISDEAEARLKSKAAIAGVDLAAYIGALIDQTTQASLALEQISGPVAKDFAISGMDEEELGDLLERAKHEIRAEKRTRRAS